MQFFFYCRDRAGAGETRRTLLGAHWGFMRGYEAAMIARGPTMSADGKSVTGSMHIVDLPDASAARAFVDDDPLARGGVFDETVVRRFHNVTGRTMWQFAGDATNPRFLFIGQARPGTSEPGGALLAAQRAYMDHADRAGRVILFGPLLAADGRTWEGTAMLLETRDGVGAQSIVQGDPAAAAELYVRADLHAWRFGGEENLRDLVARS